jgi:hypothetical protein
MAKSSVHLPVVGFGNTLRRDAWWAGPLATGAVLVAFIVYATFRAFENGLYEWGPYLSPFYSPRLPAERIGIGWLSPAMLILPGPASFRFTCYYYRKAYYRAFAMDPPACAVGERSRDYRGETRILLFQNLHRFALYLAILVLAFLWHDVWKALWFTDELGGEHFGVGVGTLVLLANTSLLTLYTFSCHSLRHLVGGGVDSYSTAPLGRLRHLLWRGVSRLNLRHMVWAWCSLFSVALTDLYIRCVATQTFSDLRLL